MLDGHGENKQSQIKRGLSFRTKVLLIVAFFNIIAIFIFTYTSYYDQRALAMKDINKRLLTSAHAVRFILPEGYHSRINSQTSVSPQEYLFYVRRLSQYAMYAGISYLYTMMESDNKIVFTSTSATDGDLENGRVDPFYTVYEDNTSVLRQALKDHRILFVESHDKSGDFRSVIVPVIMTSGKAYLIGADIDISSINEHLKLDLLKSILIGVALYIITMITAILFLRRFKGPAIPVEDHGKEIRVSPDLSGGVGTPSSDESRAASHGVIRSREYAGKDMDRDGVLHSLDKITKISQELESRSYELDSCTRDLNDATLETTKALEEMVMTIGDNAKDALDVESALKAFNETMLRHLSLIDRLNDSIRDIGVSSNQVEGLEGTMNEIAFQVNLLALSASVAAERAGAAGTDFWVIVEEIRNLARKTAQSSRDIQQTVSKNTTATKRSVGFISETSEFFPAIIDQMSGVIAKISHISRICQEQSAGIKCINEAITRTRDLGELNTVLSEMLTGSSQDLKESVTVLEQIMRASMEHEH
ncbi:MAG TPA: methyl-accepting chemotaxis protein [Desulfomonilia bacterium]|nr:methyl-accepting chemotaxis protein [Desulfomonilia bacterium]